MTLVKSQNLPAGDWKEAEENLKLCAQMLMLMEQEAVSTKPRKDAAMITVKSLRREIDNLFEEASKSSLLGRSRFEHDAEKGRLLRDDDEESRVLSNSGNSLAWSIKQVKEMQETGSKIQEDLSIQSQTMKSIGNKANRTNSLASEGRDNLRNMERRGMWNKLCAYGAVVLVFVGIVVAAYWTLFRT